MIAIIIHPPYHPPLGSPDTGFSTAGKPTRRAAGSTPRRCGSRAPAAWATRCGASPGASGTCRGPIRGGRGLKKGRYLWNLWEYARCYGDIFGNFYGTMPEYHGDISKFSD